MLQMKSRFIKQLALLASLIWTVKAQAQQPAPTQEPLTLRVQELEQRATVFTPPKTPQESAPRASALAVRKRNPAVIVLHSGFLGDDATSSALSKSFASRGILVVMPSYRGQKRALDGERSDGRIEFCSGEIDDVEKSLEWLQKRDDVDPFRIGLIGMSHGGCIALRTAIRNPRLRAVVAIDAPVAAEPVLSHLLSHPYRFFLYNGILAEQIKRYVGGSAELTPEGYAARSPLFLAGKLSMPLLIIHGSDDHIVPAQQACFLSRVLKQNGRDVKEQWLSQDGEKLGVHPDLCGLKALSPTQQNVMPAPRTELYLVKDQDHIFFSKKARKAAQTLAIDFLIQELTRIYAP